MLLLKPHIILQRRRLLMAALTALLLPPLVLLFVTGNVGFLWHSACQCRPERDDLRILLNFLSMNFVLLSLILGVTGNQGLKLQNHLGFQLTRPVSRVGALLWPFVTAGVALAILPALGIIILLLWLSSVHAPSLSYLLSDFAFLPRVGALGPHPDFLQFAKALQLGRRYIAGLLLGLDACALFESGRWLTQSPRPWLKFTGALTGSASYLLWWILPRSVLFVSSRSAPPLFYAPSDISLSLHLLFAVVWLFFTYQVLEKIEV